MVLPTTSSRQVLAWSLPTVVFVLSILWYRRRYRGSKPQTDPGGPQEQQLQEQQQQAEEEPAAAAASDLPQQVQCDGGVVAVEEKLLSACHLDSNLCEVILTHTHKIEVCSSSSSSSSLDTVVEDSTLLITAGKSESEDLQEEQEQTSESPLEPTMTEVEEQKTASEAVAATESEVAAPVPAEPVLSKISVDVKQEEQEEPRGEEEEEEERHQPRDSANHSPAEAMLASPSITNDSDTHSVGSNDSGKGGSDVTSPVAEDGVAARSEASSKRGSGSRRTSTSSSASSAEPQHEQQQHAALPVRPPAAGPSTSSTSGSGGAGAGASTPSASGSVTGEQPAAGTVAAYNTTPCMFEFVIPQHLVGRLIGKHGCFVQQIKLETNSNIFVKRHPESVKFKVCAIEGTQHEIEQALKLIRKKFPIKKYPGVTLERVMFLPPVMGYPLIPESLQMYLVECVNNDVVLSSLVNAGHMFLQQPTHPTFPVLSQLIMSMTQCYSENESPTLPNPAPGIVCAAPSLGGWYRAEVIDVRTEEAVERTDSAEPEVEEEVTVCDIKFVDYGGFMTLPACELRQIRTDFMMLPFQATECYMADITWPDGDEGWSEAATQCVEELTRDQVLQAQVVGYAENSLPLIRLFSSVHGPMQTVMVNQMLVARGLAKYYDPVMA